MTKQQINAIAMSLNFPYDHSKNEVKDLDLLVRLVDCVKSEPQRQDVIVVSEKVWKPIFQEFADEVRENNKKPKKF